MTTAAVTPRLAIPDAEFDAAEAAFTASDLFGDVVDDACEPRRRLRARYTPRLVAFLTALYPAWTPAQCAQAAQDMIDNVWDTCQPDSP